MKYRGHVPLGQSESTEHATSVWVPVSLHVVLLWLCRAHAPVFTSRELWVCQANVDWLGTAPGWAKFVYYANY